MLMIRNAALALGLVLSTATQLRELTPVLGPGELCLVAWLGLTLGHEAGRLGPPLTRPLAYILAFWTVFAFALSLGALTGLVIEQIRDPGSMLHDTISYILLTLVSGLLVMEPGAGARLRQLAWLFVLVGTPFLAVVLANAWGYVSIPHIQPWFWERLQGWSDNPNQLALLCAALGLVSLHLADTDARGSRKLAACVCTILPIYVGRLSGSDTFLIVLVLSGPLFGALKLRQWLKQTEGRIRFRSAAAWVIVAAIPMVLASGVVLGPAIAGQSETLAKSMEKNGGKESGGESKLRFALWNEAFTRGVDSLMLGLGPGAHLVSTPYKRSPPPDFEAHNTPLDLFTQGGLIAVLSFGCLVVTALVRSYKADLAGLTTLLGGLVIFSMFHLIVRHPIFWFSVALCMVAQAGTAPAGLSRRRG